MSKASKIVLSGGIALIVAAVGFYAFSLYLVSKLDGTGNVQQGPALTERYSSEDGYTFYYPNAYALSSRTEGTAERQWDVLLLVNKNQPPVGQNTEGPPAIVIGVYPNPEKLALEAWLHSDARSNWKLIVDDRASRTTTVGGLPAVWYHYSRLYENDATAVATGGKIFVFSVEWLNADDQMRIDYGRILDSVQFDL